MKTIEQIRKSKLHIKERPKCRKAIKVICRSNNFSLLELHKRVSNHTYFISDGMKKQLKIMIREMPEHEFVLEIL